MCIIKIGGVHMRFNITMPKDFYNKLKERAKERSMTISEYIRFALTLLWERGI